MKKSYNWSYKCIDTLKRVMFLSVVLTAFAFLNTKAQSNFKTDASAVVSLAAGTFKNNAANAQSSKYLSAEGNFIFKDGTLDDLKSFTIKTTLPHTNAIFPANITNDSLAFELKNVMVLPYMSLIHIVGSLEVGGVSKLTELDFIYSVNQDQSISLKGMKSIKLTDYKKDTKIIASAQKGNNEINLELNLLFKNNQVSFIAAK